MLIHIVLSVIIVIVSWQFFEPGVYNYMVKNFTAHKTGSDDIVVITIDDKSLSRYQWPWKRELYAEIFEYFDKYTETKALGLDAIIGALQQEHPESDKKFFNTLKEIDNLVVGITFLFDNDNSEAAKIYNKAFEDKFGIKVIDKYKDSKPSMYHSITKLPTEYFDSVKYTGVVNVNLDHDGDLRNSDILVSVNNISYPSFALRMYMLINNTDEVILNKNNIFIKKTGLSVPTLHLISNADITQFKTRYYKRHENSEYTHRKYSAIDIIDSLHSLKKGQKPIIDPADFKNKIVIVGVNAKTKALGLEDAHPTPILRAHPGVDIQATFIDNLVNNEFMYVTTFSQNMLIILFLSILSFIIITRTSFFKSLGVLFTIALLYYIFGIVCFLNNIAVVVITPMIIQLSTMIFGYSYQFLTEGRHKEKIKNAMGRYLSQDVMKNVVQNIDDIRLGGKKALVTVLFSDIRGFTKMSENMTPEEISVILNEYFTEMEPIVTKYNGVINKFIGDAIMAIFGEPIQDINHAQNAVRCAYEMIKKVNQLQGKWLDEGKPKIEIGVGINTGEVFVGNIGSEKRLEYTVIGDTVNIASRIESYNKVYKTNFLISSSTYSYVSSLADVIKISEVSIRGKSKKMDIYEVLRLTDA